MSWGKLARAAGNFLERETQSRAHRHRMTDGRDYTIAELLNHPNNRDQQLSESGIRANLKAGITDLTGVFQRAERRPPKPGSRPINTAFARKGMPL